MFTYGFYNSLNGDRKYDALQVSSIFDGIIEDGVYANIYEQFMVVPGTGMQIIVKTGRAWFNHTWNLNDSWLPIDLEPADILRPRIDSVVIEVDSNTFNRINSLKIVKGVPGIDPVPPTMIHETYLNQYRIANIKIPATATTIREEDIEIFVGRDETPFVTAPLKSIDISDLFNQWNGQFETWFSHIKEELTENVVTNLQKQIDERVKLEDIATKEDIDNGTPGKWLDASMAKQELSGILAGAEIGDVVYSARDLEKETGGKFLACDHRVISSTDYPKLCELDWMSDRYSIDFGPNKVIQLDTAGKMYNNLTAIYCLSNDKYIYTYSGNITTTNVPNAQYISVYDIDTGQIKYADLVNTSAAGAAVAMHSVSPLSSGRLVDVSDNYFFSVFFDSTRISGYYCKLYDTKKSGLTTESGKLTFLTVTNGPTSFIGYYTSNDKFIIFCGNGYLIIIDPSSSTPVTYKLIDLFNSYTITLNTNNVNTNNDNKIGIATFNMIGQYGISSKSLIQEYGNSKVACLSVHSASTNDDRIGLFIAPNGGDDWAFVYASPNAYPTYNDWIVQTSISGQYAYVIRYTYGNHAELGTIWVEKIDLKSHTTVSYKSYKFKESDFPFFFSPNPGVSAHIYQAIAIETTAYLNVDYNLFMFDLERCSIIKRIEYEDSKYFRFNIQTGRTSRPAGNPPDYSISPLRNLSALLGAYFYTRNIASLQPLFSNDARMTPPFGVSKYLKENGNSFWNVGVFGAGAYLNSAYNDNVHLLLDKNGASIHYAANEANSANTSIIVGKDRCIYVYSYTPAGSSDNIVVAGITDFKNYHVLPYHLNGYIKALD